MVDLTLIHGENKPKTNKQKTKIEYRFLTGLSYTEVKQRSLNLWSYIKNRNNRKYTTQDYKLIWKHIHETTSGIIEGGKERKWASRVSLSYFY